MTVKEKTEKLISWIKEWFEQNGPNCNAVLGISGGKDSTICAKLCVEALGSDRVIGVLMPNGIQKDINYSEQVCSLLGIKYFVHNIDTTVQAVINGMSNNSVNLSKQSLINLPARIRMSTLYAYSQSLNGRVVNTCNLSEEMVGYSTRWGDSVGDFSPLGNLTVMEVLEIGDYLGLPQELVHKTPIDGLNIKEDGSYVTDEDNLGVTYAEIDSYLGVNPTMIDNITWAKVDDLVHKSVFKRKSIPTFKV